MFYFILLTKYITKVVFNLRVTDNSYLLQSEPDLCIDSDYCKLITTAAWTEMKNEIIYML